MRRRLSGRRWQRQQKETIWSAVLIDRDSVDNTSVAVQNIVDDLDWGGGANGGFMRGATLERIRGTISINFGGVSASALATVWLSIWKVNDSETAPDPRTVTDYVEEDLLWSSCVSGGILNLANGMSTPQTVQVEVDVKAKRKLDTNSIILLSYGATGTNNSAVLSAIIRGLIKKA